MKLKISAAIALAISLAIALAPVVSAGGKVF